MIDTPTFDDVPEFAHDGTKVKPGTAKYSGGHVSGEILPFDYYNWFMNGLTKNGVTEQAQITSINAELKSILTAHGITPGSELTNQLAGVFARYVFGDNSRATISITDANTPTKSGPYSLASPYTNGPTAAAYLICHIQQSESDNYAMQIASLATGNNSYMRTKNNGNWTGWATIWNSSNDGAGSGLDAGRVCGIDPIDGTLGISGTLSIPHGTGVVIPKGTYIISGSNLNPTDIIFQMYIGTDWRGGVQAFSGGLIISDGTNFRFLNPSSSVDTTVYFRKLA